MTPKVNKSNDDNLCASLSRILMTRIEMAEYLSRTPNTFKNRLRKSPNSFPPVTDVSEPTSLKGVVQKRNALFFRAIASAWLADEHFERAVEINLSGLPAVLKIEQLAALLHLSVSTVTTLKSRNPDALPPGGKYNLWQTRAVFDWLADRTDGIPRDKIEIVAPVAKQMGTADLLMSCTGGRSR